MKSISRRAIRRISWISIQTIRPIYLFLNSIYYSIFRHAVECNICGYKSRRFKSDIWHLYCTCPKCGSHIRHRLLWASLSFIEDIKFEKIISNKDILHFAPEKISSEKLRHLSKNYKSADFFANGYFYKDIDFNLDMSDMRTINDEEYDCVIACDVLEHVPRHLNAMKEAYRILKKGGYCIFTVPQPDNWEKTLEDLSDLSPKEREKRFAQFDHWRMYGEDFIEMLISNGFIVTIIEAGNFDNEIVNKFVLYPPIKSIHPLATNDRRIFFARK